MSSARFECQKFSPNFFDKSKCQNCFRSKDQHSAEALESNRASRKISKCGYLFVAPDWDFSNPLYRTKRWQRRWFVLYEDGELTYSVDEHPDTIPQAIIDMTKVVKVADAEDVTGNQFAVSISTPDKVHFIKGTCKEESKWWYDVLVMYPRNVKGRQKRNSTFPCIVATKNLTSTSIKSRSGDGRGSWNETIIPRHRFLSCHTDPSCLSCDQLNDYTLSGHTVVKKVSETTDSNLNEGESKNVIPRDLELIIADSARKSRADTHQLKRTTRREVRKQLYNRSRSLGPTPCSSVISKEETNGGRPSSPFHTSEVANSHHRVPSPLYVRLSDVPRMKRYDSLESLHNDQNGPMSPRPWCQVEDSGENEDGCCLDDGIATDIPSHKQYKLHSNGALVGHRHRQKENEDRSLSNASSESCERTLGTPVELYEAKNGVAVKSDIPGDASWRETTIRGDPDGCGLDHIVSCPSSINEIRADPLDPFPDSLLNMKKGWLMRQEINGKWCKHWCLLYGSSLKLFRDLTAEDSGDWDSIISMNLVQHVEEADAGRNYGFKIKMTDGKTHVFSALTAGIRSSWILALQNSANRRDRERPLTMRREILHSSKSLDVRDSSHLSNISTPSCSPPSTFSSDEVLRTVTGAHHHPISPSCNSLKDDADKTPAPGGSRGLLPASPPLNRTAISKVKERARHKTNVKTSPKSSKNSSDIVGHDGEEVTDAGKSSRDLEALTETTMPWTSKKIDKDAIKDTSERSSAKSNHSKDKNRRFTLPGKSSVSLSRHSDSSVTKHAGRSTSSNKEKEKKWDGNEAHERLCSIRVKLPDQDTGDGCLLSEPPSDDGSPGSGTSEVLDIQNAEIVKLKEALDRAHGELVDVVNRLQKATDENEALRKALSADCRMVGHDGSVKKSLPRVGSLSDLTNIGEELDIDSATKESLAENYKELRIRFEKAVNEIKVLKKELKEAYGKYDELEVACMNRRHETMALETDYKSQISLMSVRIEDLTAKLSNSEKQLRNQLASKQLRSSGRETKEQRRTRSLKGREALTVSKEVENKVDDLEKKLLKVQELLHIWDGGDAEDAGNVKRQWTSPSPDTNPDGVDNSSKSGEHVFVRLNSLESKVNGVAQRAMAHSLSSSSRTSLANDYEVDEGSLPNKSEGCPSDCDASDRDVPVTRISESNDKVENLGERNLNLEWVCKQNVEQCRTIMNEIGSSDDAQGEKFAALRDLLRDVERRLTETKVHQPFHISESDATTLVFNRDILKYSLLKSTIDTLSLDPPYFVCPHSLVLQNARRLREVVRKSLRELKVVGLTHLECDDEDRNKVEKSSEPEAVLSDALRRLLEELPDDELLLRATIAARKEEAIQMIVKVMVNETETNDGGFDRLPTVVLINELFFQAERIIARKLAESEVVDALSRLLYVKGDIDAVVFNPLSVAPLSQLQKLEDRKARLIGEHLAMEVENTLDALRTGYERAIASPNKLPHHSNEEDLQMASIVSRLRDFVDVVAQVALCSACLAFIHTVISSIGMECPGQGVCNFDDVWTKSGIADNCPPPPRVVGGVVKSSVCGYSGGVRSLAFQPMAHEFSASHPFEISWPLSETGFVKTPNQKGDDSVKQQNVEGSSTVYWLMRNTGSGDNEDGSCKMDRSVKKDGTFGGQCQQCKELQRKVQQMAEKYANDLLLETERHQSNLDAFYQQQTENMSRLEKAHSEDVARYQDEIKNLQEKLISVEDDYEQQVLSLKETFEQEISKRTNIKLNKANVQQKYRAEIEQLKNLCEKGLVAMEHSHRRIIAELEEKHRCEIEQLLMEKEQALAEETQATLAALDAMRKAHETELQREVARFKEEFLKKMGHSSADLDILRHQHKEEMESIKSKILDVSEKYSVKCLECAALEEHLEVTTEKLTEANTLIFELTARNRHLRSRLKQSIRDLSLNVTDANESRMKGENVKDLELSLEMRERELVEKDEQIADLTRKLAATKIHESELENQCRFLDASLEAGNKAAEDDMGVLKARLEHIISKSQQQTCDDGDDKSKVMANRSLEKMRLNVAAPHYQSGRSSNSTTTSTKQEQQGAKVTTSTDSLRNQEFLRTLSCPSFRETDNISSASSSSITTTPTTTTTTTNNKANSSFSPLVGVVASRKRMFEYQDVKHQS